MFPLVDSNPINVCVQLVDGLLLEVGIRYCLSTAVDAGRFHGYTA
jgi:hypothetical protein